jgi:hypothetical protein
MGRGRRGFLRIGLGVRARPRDRRCEVRRDVAAVTLRRRSRPDPSLEDPRSEALRQSYLHERELDEIRDFDTWEDRLYGY